MCERTGRSNGMLQFLFCTTLYVAFLESNVHVDAFSPCMRQNNVQSLSVLTNGRVSKDYRHLKPTTLQSSSDDDNREYYYDEETGEYYYVEEGAGEGYYQEEEVYQNQQEFSDAQFEQPLDPLVKALTQMDEETANAPTMKVPLLGEIPLDGSIVVLLPAALIAVAGFIFSIVIGIQSRDLIANEVSQVTEVLSTPPVKEQVVNTNSCRGLCSDQDEELESMKRFMQKFASEKQPAVQAPVTKGEDLESTKVFMQKLATEKESAVEAPVAKEEEVSVPVVKEEVASPVSEKSQAESSIPSNDKTESLE